MKVTAMCSIFPCISIGSHQSKKKIIIVSLYLTESYLYRIHCEHCAKWLFCLAIQSELKMLETPIRIAVPHQRSYLFEIPSVSSQIEHVDRQMDRNCLCIHIVTLCRQHTIHWCHHHERYQHFSKIWLRWMLQ